MKLLSSPKIRICHEYISVLPPLIEPNIGAKNQSALIISIGVVQAPQALHLAVVQETVADATLDNIGTNRYPRQIIRTGVDGITSALRGICRISYHSPSSSFWSSGIANNSNPLPQIYGSPNNWTLPLMGISPIIRFQHPLSLKYSVIYYPTVPEGISMRAVGCNSRHIPSIPWHHSS